MELHEQTVIISDNVSTDARSMGACRFGYSHACLTAYHVPSPSFAIFYLRRF